MYIIDQNDFGALLSLLAKEGYTSVGPTVREGAIVCDVLNSVEDLPRGWVDVQAPGSYRLQRKGGGKLFGYVVGPQSWKKFLFPIRSRLYVASKSGKGFEVFGDKVEQKRLAFIGVRSCELHAIAIQDKVFMSGEYADPTYAARRADVFLVGVNCTAPGGNCFCASMKTGPRCGAGFDLILTEISRDGSSVFAVEAGSPRGEAVLQQVPHRPAGAAEINDVETMMNGAEAGMGKTLDTSGIRELLNDNFEHPAWDDVAKRCLACANCTMVCPTCFCSTVEDTTDLLGSRAERWRRWDSCFTSDFTKIAGGNIRMSTRTRYRQWMTHKLGSWHDQFDSSGCVGCGRCITWCPVGIDITAEARRIRETSVHPISG